jgi:hypothetical protein
MCLTCGCMMAHKEMTGADFKHDIGRNASAPRRRPRH